MGLKDEILRLIDLQKIDIQIHSLCQEKDLDIPAKLQNLKNDFESKKKILNDALEIIKQAQLRKKDKELDLASKEEAIIKANAALYQLKTNREYQAKLQEIASLKADRSVLDEAVLKALEAIEIAEKKKKEIETVLIDSEKKLQEEMSVIDSRLENIKAELAILADKHTILSRNADEKILNVYNKLVKTRAGIALAPVNGENCGICCMSVTAQLINEIKMYRDLVFCQTCSRILYIPEES